MKHLGIKDAKTFLSTLVTDAINGEVVIISKHGKGKGVRLVPVDTPSATPSGFGMFADRFKDLPEDFWTNPAYDIDFSSVVAEHGK